MRKPHISSCKGAELCKPQAHTSISGNPAPIAPRPSRPTPLVATACLLLCQTAFASTHAYANDSTDLIPSTEEEILQDAIDNPSGSEITPAARRRGFCRIVLVNQGELREVPGTYKLSSKGAGARPGIARVTANRNRFRISVDQPLGFTNAPAGGNTSVTMQAGYSGRGSTNFSETPGEVTQRLRRGTTRVELNLEARRNDSTPFPAGSYTAELTLRCE